MAQIVKGLLKYAWGGISLAVMVTYTVEFFLDQHGMIPWKNQKLPHVAVIYLYVFILLSSIFGIIGSVFESRVMAGIFAFVLAILTIADEVFVGQDFAYITGQLATGIALAFSALGGPSAAPAAGK